MESFNASGLGLMVRFLRVFGFRLDRETVINRWVCGFIIVIGILNLCIALPTMIFTLPDIDQSLDKINLSIVIIVTAIGNIVTLFSYILMVRVARHYSILLRSLASAISRISDDSIRRKTASGLRITFIFFLFPIVGSCVPILIAKMNNQLWLNQPADTRPFTHKIVNIVSFSVNCIWLVTSFAFYALTNGVVGIVCKALVNVIDYNLPVEAAVVNNEWAQSKHGQSSDINRRLVLHQKMSWLVREANRVFSSFLLISLCEELMVGVIYVKMITMSGGNFAASSLNHAIQIFTLVLKAYVCGNVNDKLKASLLMSHHPNSIGDYCSKPLVNYIFYVNEQLINRAELTYGGFFPVKKTFIFTVAGTILTYALVITGMPDSTNNNATPHLSQLLNVTCNP